MAEISQTKEMESLLDAVYKLAEQNEKKCTGCAQSALAALLDTLEIKNDSLFKAASGMADGFGLSGDGSCGALSAGAMAIGLLFGRERKNFADPMAAMNSYLLVKELHQDFIDRYGSCRCHDIQQKLMGRTFNLLDEKELKEAFKFGMMDHCSKVVAHGARKTMEIIQQNLAKSNA